MPATEETFRKQSTLHLVFAVSSIAMTAVTIWMIMADHLRPWKNVQRDFQKIETAKLKANEDQKLQEQQENSSAQIEAIDKKVEALDALAATNARKIANIDAEIAKLGGTRERLDTERKFQKAGLDSLRSFYDGMIDRNERPRANDFLAGTIVPSERTFETIVRDYEAAVRDLDRKKLDRGLLAAEVVEVADTPPPGTPAAVAGFKKGDTLPVAEFEKLRNEAEAAIAPPKGQPAREANVSVTVLRSTVTKGADGKPEITTKSVPLTLNVKPGALAKDDQNRAGGFETIGLPVTAVTSEVLKKKREDLTRDRDRVARALAQKQAQYGEGSGFGGFLNRSLATLRGLPIIDLAAPPTKIQQISLPELLINYNFKEVPRYDRCTTCHLGIDRPGYDKTADGQPMPAVFHTHPHLKDGARAPDARGNIVTVGLYLDSDGPHKINSFGCTICHGGQGSGTSFTYASHEPDDLHEKEVWEKKYDWTEMHHWDEPMLPTRFLQSSCLKCHHQVTDLNDEQAPKLLAGYQRITKYGCTGCHTIGGEGSFGPDLTDNRQVGPNLKHLGSKVTKDWALKWIKNPHAFRPDTRMPRFYEVSNNEAPEDRPKVHAEIHAMAHYLFAVSTPPKEFVDPPVEGHAEKGKDLFFSKGCMACHSHKEYAPDGLPAGAQPFASSNFGPNLSNIAAKFDPKTGFKWLANWIKNPEAYHPKSLMPNLQLSWEDSADIAAWLLSVKPDSVPARWSEGEFQVPPVDSEEVKAGLDELVKLYLGKSKTYKRRTVLLSEVDKTVAEMSLDDKLTYVGEKTISRLGCFGCHNITGYESAKPIGTPLNGWGIKSPSKLDFGHIAEYLEENRTLKDPAGTAGPAAHDDLPRKGRAHAVVGGEGDGEKVADYDGTDEYYKEKIDDHTRMGFLYQKLHRPRSYDAGKNNPDLKSWDDRLRMPQFVWANDPKAVEEVMTFVLGLTGERIPAKYLPRYNPTTTAVAKGERLLERYNCRGCHVLAMPKYTVALGTKATEAFPDFRTNVDGSYTNRSKDYLSFYSKANPEFAAVGGLTYDEKIKNVVLQEDLKTRDGKLVDPDGQAVDPKATLIVSDEKDGQPVTIEGMPKGVLEDEDASGKPVKKVIVQLWKPVTIRGYTFNVGDTLQVNPDRVTTARAEGGDFAWLYSITMAEKSGAQVDQLWNRLPPPLLREGKKVQTPWLTSFLQDPYAIRPAAQLRMPRFHYGSTAEEVSEERPTSEGSKAREEARGETRDIANYFAGRDGAEFPYQAIPEREQAYLEAEEKAHKDYLNGGWQIITKGLCVQCHAIGSYKPAGGAQNVNGPDLKQVSGRFRPGYLYEWLAQPARLVPYTAMPQNIPPRGDQPPGVPDNFKGQPQAQVKAMRDTLLNYVTAQEQQLAGAKPAEPAKAAEPPKEKAGGGQD